MKRKADASRDQPTWAMCIHNSVSERTNRNVSSGEIAALVQVIVVQKRKCGKELTKVNNYIKSRTPGNHRLMAMLVYEAKRDGEGRYSLRSCPATCVL